MFKLYYDVEWCDKLFNLIENGDMFSMEYMKLVCQAIMPVLIIADIVIMIPIIFYSNKKNIVLYQKIETTSTLILVSIGLILNVIVSVVIELLPDSVTTSQYDQLTSLVMSDSVLLTLFISGFLAPVIEELIFRFGICKVAYKDNAKKAIIVSSVLFGVAHMNLIQSTYAFVLGLFLAYLYIKTDNLWTSTLVHITINSSSILYEYCNHIAVILVGVLTIAITLGCILRKKAFADGEIENTN